jgi:serine/threonine-protein kinase
MSDAQRKLAEERVGRTIKGKYRIDAVLGMGGMAVVYAVTHARNNASLAMKMLHPEYSYSEDVRQRFLREGYAGNTVAHPGVVMVVDDDVTEEGAVYLVMERLRGESLEQLERIGVQEAVAIVDQLLDVLTAAHEKGIVHRDVKPANLFLTRDGTVKVLDFGIAKVRDALASVGGGQMTGSGVLMGTPAFMSPEQALAKTNEIDARSDVWAAGATLYTLISGRFVHESENAPQMLVKAATQPAPSLAGVAPRTPAPIVAVVARALAQQREARYPSANAMREDLRRAHQAVWGSLPSRDRLVALVGGTATSSMPHAVAIARTEAAPLAPTSPLSAPPAATTARPMMTEPPVVPVRQPPYVLGALGLAALIGLGAGGWFVTHRSSANADASTSASAEPSTATPALSSPPASPAHTDEPPPATSVDPRKVGSTAPTHVATPTAIVSASAAVRATASSTPVAAASSTMKPPTTAPSASAKPNCNPPYILDGRGHRTYKQECL